MKKYLKYRSKNGLISYIIEKRTINTILILLFVSLVLLIMTISIGNTNVSFIQVIKTLLGQGSKKENVLINILRLPRGLAALFAGMALAAAGAILQGIIRNPLASPSILGITGGASFSSVLFITFLSSMLSIKWLPLFSILGAGLVTFIIYILAWDKGVRPIRLVLIGIGISATMSALVNLMIIVSPIYLANQAYIWLTGSVYGTNWNIIYSVIPIIILFLILALTYSREVEVQEFGDEIAAGVGSGVQKNRFILLSISVGLAGAGVSLAGALGFVGLIAPHIARKLVNRSFDGILVISALSGGIIVLVADLIARTAFTPLDIPAGVFTSGIGAPFFIYLLYRNSIKAKG